MTSASTRTPTVASTETIANAELTAFGWNADWDETYKGAVAALSKPKRGKGKKRGAPAGDIQTRPGRVVRTHRVGFDAVTTNGREFVIHQASRRNPLAAPATGDMVVIGDVPDVEHPVILTVLERHTALVRRDPADRASPQVLASNSDVIGVVQGADRPVNPRRLERMLSVSYGSGADVVVIVTKADANPDAAEEVHAAVAPTPVVVTASKTGLGVDEVDKLTANNRTVALLGESGAGKSSLVNAVMGHELVATGAVREGDAKGRHTTTRRELIALPQGGAMLDTPGVRSIALWPDMCDLETVFGEIFGAAEHCKFRDCSHMNEPKCAVRQAIENGTISQDRLDALHTLQDELAETQRQLDQRGWR